ncbi:hypothetical protein D1816_13390 [Aquimarina sp. AD10]|uniref:Uncharacterized protein n=1 Tax=Aquimarina aggregata TaxID=1642818 RepID=A0A162YW13_9FLAO|nr:MULTISPECIES: hypothetical protein [Aquimarina]AXT61299.1 hypothetical protein D1816_13390 [Aquimarina sp. AD10]KZS39395.1 hypothetical protein AWE51_12700 [Aquimarina aggregata]RKN01506.1 hypothetical protein D7033_04585 [Aquimarina sp. AD10]
MIKKEIGIGLLSGILVNSLGFILCVFIFSILRNLTFMSTINAAVSNDSLGSIIVLGAIPNLAVFFYFLKKEKIYRARGVLLATLIAAICIAISKFG